MSAPQMTERQEASMKRLVAEAREFYDVSVRSVSDLDITYFDETRPGRGHTLRFSYVDSDHAIAGSCDVYGFPSLYVAEVSQVHSSDDDECDCKPCRVRNAAEVNA